MYFDGIGNTVFNDKFNMSGIGVAFRVNPAGGFLKADNVYSQGNYMPYFSLARDVGDFSAIFEASIRQEIFDTTTVPVMANYGGHALTLDLVNSTASSQPHVTGSDGRINLHLSGSTGTTSNIGVSTLNVGAGAFDGTLGGVVLPTDFIDKNVALGPAFSIFSKTGPPAAPWAHERFEGYRRALREAGLDVDDKLVFQSGSTIEDGTNAALQMLNEVCQATAVQAVSDLVAIGCANALLSQGLRIPDDISLVGFGNILTAEHFQVPLTTVRQPKFRLGIAAVDMMMGLIRGEKVQTKRLPAELIERKSTGAPRAAS